MKAEKEKKAQKKKEKKLARKARKEHSKLYDRTWGTPVGQDCIELRRSLTSWLGKRLVFLGDFTNSYPMHFESCEQWRSDLSRHGVALLRYAKEYEKGEIDVQPDDAKQALEFVAANLGHMKD